MLEFNQIKTRYLINKKKKIIKQIMIGQTVLYDERKGLNPYGSPPIKQRLI